MFHARFQRGLDRGRADTTRRSVDNPEQARIVIRVRQDTHVGEHVLHFAPVEKALPADDPIRDLETTEVFLQQTRLRVHPEQNRETFPDARFAEITALNFFRDELRFFAICRARDEPDLAAAFARAPKFLRTAPRIIFDERIGAAEDGVRAPVILLELYDLWIWEMPLELEDVG